MLEQSGVGTKNMLGKKHSAKLEKMPLYGKIRNNHKSKNFKGRIGSRSSQN